MGDPPRRCWQTQPVPHDAHSAFDVTIAWGARPTTPGECPRRHEPNLSSFRFEPTRALVLIDFGFGLSRCANLPFGICVAPRGCAPTFGEGGHGHTPPQPHVRPFELDLRASGPGTGWSSTAASRRTTRRVSRAARPRATSAPAVPARRGTPPQIRVWTRAVNSAIPATRRHRPRACAPLPAAAAAKAQAPYQKIHFKNAVEVVHAVRGMDLTRAKSYLGNVLEQKEAIPFQRFKGGRGRHAQAKNLKVPGSLVGWPKSAVKSVLSMLTNAEANAETKGLDLRASRRGGGAAWRGRGTPRVAAAAVAPLGTGRSRRPAS